VFSVNLFKFVLQYILSFLSKTFSCLIVQITVAYIPWLLIPSSNSFVFIVDSVFLHSGIPIVFVVFSMSLC